MIRWNLNLGILCIFCFLGLEGGYDFEEEKGDIGG